MGERRFRRTGSEGSGDESGHRALRGTGDGQALALPLPASVHRPIPSGARRITVARRAAAGAHADDARDSPASEAVPVRHVRAAAGLQGPARGRDDWRTGMRTTGNADTAGKALVVIPVYGHDEMTHAV